MTGASLPVEVLKTMLGVALSSHCSWTQPSPEVPASLGHSMEPQSYKAGQGQSHNSLIAAVLPSVQHDPGK